MTRERKKLFVSQLELALHVFVEFIVGNRIELHVPGVRHLVVGCQVLTAEM